MPALTTLCFLTADAMPPAVSGSCCHAPPTTKDWTFKCESLDTLLCSRQVSLLQQLETSHWITPHERTFPLLLRPLAFSRPHIYCIFTVGAEGKGSGAWVSMDGQKSMLYYHEKGLCNRAWKEWQYPRASSPREQGWISCCSISCLFIISSNKEWRDHHCRWKNSFSFNQELHQGPHQCR